METTSLIDTNFSTIDWIIVIAYPMISLGIGIFVSKFIKNMNDFVCAGKGLLISNMKKGQLNPLKRIMRRTVVNIALK